MLDVNITLARDQGMIKACIKFLRGVVVCDTPLFVTFVEIYNLCIDFSLYGVLQ